MSKIKYKIKKSPIHGKGVFPKTKINKNEIIGVGIKYSFFGIPIITPGFGTLINHSYKPSCRLVSKKDKGWLVVANKTLSNQHEITINYNNTPWFIENALPHYR
tara:strand:+ start:600 stop:911 length:312 start_codon:yes stop_codon:yes gene_type:complete